MSIKAAGPGFRSRYDLSRTACFVEDAARTGYCGGLRRAACATFLSAARNAVNLSRSMSASELAVAFFLQMFVILATCRFAGWLMRRWLRQPQVVGEMIAGVVLGPSFFGLLAPELQGRLFPPESKAVLYVVAQLGIGLYMFLVGVEFRSDISGRARRAPLPCRSPASSSRFCRHRAGTPLSHERCRACSPRTSRNSRRPVSRRRRSSITAFPMLARIIQERGLTGRRSARCRSPRARSTTPAPGACSRWCSRASARVRGRGDRDRRRHLRFGWCSYSVRAAVRAARTHRRSASGTMSHHACWASCSCCSCCPRGSRTHRHPCRVRRLLLGTAMPRGVFADELTAAARAVHGRIPAADVLRLSRDSTRSSDMVNTPELLWIAVADSRRLDLRQVRGLLGCGAAHGRGQPQRARHRRTDERARPHGADHPQHRSAARHHRPALFSMLVIMAIVTTLMASPLFEWVYGRHARRAGLLAAAPGDDAPGA